MTSALRRRLWTGVLSLGALLLLPIQAPAQIANGQGKYLGNVIGSSVPSNFATYWNQITPENAGKWGSVESTRNSMNWSQLDTAYNFAQQNGFKFKGHTLVWGSQFPSWLSQLTPAQQRAEIEEWIRLYAQRYPNTWAIDVVNEPIKTPYPFEAALGGDGATGWDWVITAFQLARQYLPNTLLLINEYGTENDPSARSQYLTIINLLRSRGLLDGIGVQAHYFNLDNMTAAQMTSALDAYAATGLNIYISELDITGGGSAEAGQSTKYQQLFPVMWNHASVKGITLWGYIVGQTWRENTGLVNSNGTERQAMTWLKGFVSGNPNPNPNPNPDPNPNPNPNPSVALVIKITNDWGAGYCATGDVTNNTSSAVAWTVTAPLTGTIYNRWNAVITVSNGTLQATGVDWNRTLQPGAATQFGFCANR